MSYRDLLVHLDGNAAGPAFMARVAEFASGQEAHLTGLHVIDIPEIPGYVEANIPRDVLQNHRKLFLEEAGKIESVFSDACHKTALSFEWRCVEDDTVRAVIRAARCSDLVLAAGGAGIDSADRTSVADQVILEGGRPVLIIPPHTALPAIGNQVVVAWNATKEAARAIHDALPILARAKAVTVVSVNPETSDEAHGEIPGADIAAHLSRHGVNTEAQSLRIDHQETGSGLLEWASEQRADLLVMGAYGHTRWRELVLGGVTAHVLRNTGIPVFMSH